MESQDHENVTLRRAKTTLLDDRSEIDMSKDTLEVSSCSLPELSADNNSVVLELQQTIEQLQTQLNSAHLEIEQLSSENKDLRQHNQELSKKNSLYRKIGFSPTNKAPSGDTPPRKNPNRTQKNKGHQHTQTDKMENLITIDKQNKETQTNTLIQTEKTTQTSNTIIETETYIHTTGKKIPNIAKIEKNSSKLQENPTYKPKICLLSSNRENRVLSIAQEIMPSTKYDLCHYLSPQASTRHLIKNLQTKLKDFTREDFCIIFISEEDFLDSSNQIAQIKHIRQTLQEVTHTNIILCTPTYQTGHQKDSFNRKVFSFNELLLKDAQIFNYAHITDSNKYLCYDYTMFHKPTGRINNAGLRIIMQDVAWHLSDTSFEYNVEHKARTSYNKEISSADDQNQFFLA